MSHFVEELPKRHEPRGNERHLLALADVRAAPGVVVEECGPGWLAHRVSDGGWLQFAVLEFYDGNWSGDGDKITGERVEVAWRGEGPGGVDHPLRELRHSYFGRDGYLFYAPLDLFAAAIPMLKRWFDA